jgi:hypothetical protein
MFHIIHCREQRKIRCFEWPSSGFWTAALPIEPVVAGKGPRQGATFVQAKTFLGGGGGCSPQKCFEFSVFPMVFVDGILHHFEDTMRQNTIVFNSLFNTTTKHTAYKT